MARHPHPNLHEDTLMFAQFFAGMLIAAVAVPEAAAPVPDVVVPGTRRVKVELRIEAQPLIDHCCVQHVVAKGETLSKIAANHRQHMLTSKVESMDSISPTKVKDILALNPGLNPDKLAIGQRIWMPPRIPGGPNAENIFVFIDQRSPTGGPGEPFAATSKVSASRGGSTIFVLVPESMLSVREAAKKARTFEDYQAFNKSDKIQFLRASGSSGQVREESPVHSCKDTITFARSKKGVLSVKLTSVAFDKAGKVIPPNERNKVVRKKQGAWLFVLPVAGAGWLLWHSRRRRAPAMLATA
tara:strand:+ start:5554 stop:6450 length:897 start_codon:yes stop_codon:yes gene_type:complete